MLAHRIRRVAQRVLDKAVFPAKAQETHAGAFGDVDRERGRRRYRGEQWNVHSRRLVHEFVARPARQKDEAVLHVFPAASQTADQLVERVVTVHVLKHFNDGAVGLAPCGRVDASCLDRSLTRRPS